MKAKDILLCPTCKHHVLMGEPPHPQHVPCPCDLLVCFQHSSGGGSDALSQDVALYSFIPQVITVNLLCAGHCPGSGERPARQRGACPPGLVLQTGR